MESSGEEQSVEQVIDRLAKKFPATPREEIVTVVEQEHQAFAGRPVRDFVPVLVERQAKKRLKATPKSL